MDAATEAATPGCHCEHAAVWPGREDAPPSHHGYGFFASAIDFLSGSPLLPAVGGRGAAVLLISSGVKCSCLGTFESIATRSAPPSSYTLSRPNKK